MISPQTANAPKAKNSPEMWQFALKQIGFVPDEALHVDNDYETGILRAREVGLRAVLINRTNMDSTLDCRVIHSLCEVVKIIDEAQY